MPNILLTVQFHKTGKKNRLIKMKKKIRFLHLATRFMITYSLIFLLKLAVSSDRKGSGDWAELQVGKICLRDFKKKSGIKLRANQIKHQSKGAGKRIRNEIASNELRE